MSESQQPKRGWLRSWREAPPRQAPAVHGRAGFTKHGRAGNAGAMYGRHAPYEHSGPITFGSAGGFDGGGCGGDGGGGGC